MAIELLKVFDVGGGSRVVIAVAHDFGGGVSYHFDGRFEQVASGGFNLFSSRPAEMLTRPYTVVKGRPGRVAGDATNFLMANMECWTGGPEDMGTEALSWKWEGKEVRNAHRVKKGVGVRVSLQVRWFCGKEEGDASPEEVLERAKALSEPVS